MRTARPILFSTPMIRALLDGRKSMTRRVVKPQPDLRVTEILLRDDSMWGGFGRACLPAPSPQWNVWRPMPFDVGNLLYVKETFAHVANFPPTVRYYATDDVHELRKKIPSIYMPRWASRLTLELTDVRVERLQDMEGQHPSESDAIAEGVNKIHHGDGAYYYSAFRNDPHPKNWCDPTDAFRELWEKLNGNGSWDLNPWVWVLSFKVHHANVDAVLAQRAEVADAMIAEGNKDGAG